MIRRDLIVYIIAALGPVWVAFVAAVLALPGPGPLARLVAPVAAVAMLATSFVLRAFWLLPACFFIPLGLWASFKLRHTPGAVQERSLARLRLMLGVLAWAAFLVSKPMVHLRYAAARVCAARAEPVTAALTDYHLAAGRYPDSLSELTPRYLPSVPLTGALASPHFTYVRKGAPAGSGGYELVIPMPAAGRSFEGLVYWPTEKYPAQMFGGEVVVLGRWAYVQD